MATKEEAKKLASEETAKIIQKAIESLTDGMSDAMRSYLLRAVLFESVKADSVPVSVPSNDA